MLATLFLVAGTALSCVYGIKESNVDDGFDAPSFLETPCVLKSVKRSGGDSCLSTGIPSFDELASPGEGIGGDAIEPFDVSMVVENPTRAAQTSSKLTKLTSGDANKDLYWFSTREKLRFDFSVTNPSNYKFQIRRYQRKTTKFVCESLKSFSVELLPATYYLYVEDENGSAINSSSYKVDFSTKRVSNNVPFSGTRQSPFKMILWENEIWPFNASRRGKETQTLQGYVKTRRGTTAHGVYNGYLDPALMLDGKSTGEESEEYLESVLYILNADLKKQTSLYFKNIAKTADAKLQSGLYNKTKFEAVKTGLDLVVKIIGFTPAGQAVDLLYDVVKFASGQSGLASLIQYIGRTSYQSDVVKVDGRYLSQVITHAYGLATAANALSFSDDVCLEIPRYFKIKKDVIRNNKYSILIHWDISTSYLTSAGVNYNEMFSHKGLIFSPKVKIDGIDKTYYGSLSLLYGEDALAKLLDAETKSPDEM